MKKIKLIFFVFLIAITCTGCTVEYSINITSNYIDETINVNDTTSEQKTKEDILNSYNKWYPVYNDFTENLNNPGEIEFNDKMDGVKYYEKTIQEVSDGYNYTYKFTHVIDEYKNTNVLINSFDDVNVFEGDGYLVLKTSKKNLLCDEETFGSLTVNITIDPEIYTLNTTNADSKENNTYTWYLDKSNCNDSQIILTLDRKKIKSEETNIPSNDNIQNQNNQTDNNKRNDYTMYIFSAILLIVMLTGYLIFNKIKNNNDKMDV